MSERHNKDIKHEEEDGCGYESCCPCPRLQPPLPLARPGSATFNRIFYIFTHVSATHNIHRLFAIVGTMCKQINKMNNFGPEIRLAG